MTYQIPEGFGLDVDAIKAQDQLNTLGKRVLGHIFEDVISPGMTFSFWSVERRPDVVLGAMLSRISMNKVAQSFGIASLGDGIPDVRESSLIQAGFIVKNEIESLIIENTNTKGEFSSSGDTDRKFAFRIANKLAQHDAFKAGPK